MNAFRWRVQRGFRGLGRSGRCEQGSESFSEIQINFTSGSTSVHAFSEAAPTPGCTGHTAASIAHDRAAVRPTHGRIPRPVCARRPLLPPRTAPARRVLRAGLSQTLPALPLRRLPLAQSMARITLEPLPRSPSTLGPRRGSIIPPQSPAWVWVDLRRCREVSRIDTEMWNHTHEVWGGAPATTDTNTHTHPRNVAHTLSFHGPPRKFAFAMGRRPPGRVPALRPRPAPNTLSPGHTGWLFSQAFSATSVLPIFS